MRLLVRPDTVLRWHRDLVARRHAAHSRPKRPGRPRTILSVRGVVLRLAAENPGWGLPPRARRAARSRHQGRRVHRLRDPEGGRDPTGTRAHLQHLGVLPRSQTDALLACDFFETVTLSGARLHVLTVIEYANRRIRILGATAHPTASWVAQAAKNLIMDLEDAGTRARFLIRDRDGKFPELVDAVLADAGIQVVLSGVRMPRMNSLIERWAQTCRRELLDRTLIWGQRHLLHALREFEKFYNEHRPHQASRTPAPSDPFPSRSTTRSKSHDSTYAEPTALAASSTSTHMRPEQGGSRFRQGQPHPPGIARPTTAVTTPRNPHR